MLGVDFTLDLNMIKSDGHNYYSGFFCYIAYPAKSSKSALIYSTKKMKVVCIFYANRTVSCPISKIHTEALKDDIAEQTTSLIRFKKLCDRVRNTMALSSDENRCHQIYRSIFAAEIARVNAIYAPLINNSHIRPPKSLIQKSSILL